MIDTTVIMIKNALYFLTIMVVLGVMTRTLKEEIREERDIVVNEYYVCQGDTMLVDIIVY